MKIQRSGAGKKALHPNFIVGIGGSAGGLDSYIALFDALPSNTGMAFVIVSHLLPTANSLLAEILSSHTKMPVKVASKAMPILANHVYVGPPNADLLIENCTFEVVRPRTRNKQVDMFFNSLAAAMGAGAIGIIFSGYDGDGTAGCIAIQAEGGTTFAQDKSAKVDEMPRSAQSSGCVDHVLPPGKIADALQRLARTVVLPKFHSAVPRKAYLRVKEFRKTDPRQIVMMEKLKQERRDSYQKAKERWEIIKVERKNAADRKVAEDRVAKQKNLMAKLVPQGVVRGTQGRIPDCADAKRRLSLWNGARKTGPI